MEINNNEDELWLPIQGFEGLYEVSNLGRIKALKKIRKTGRKGSTIRIYDERIMKPSTKSKRGYEIINLRKNNIYFYKTVHRIVALTFIPNPENKCCVNHMDSNRLNNKVSNLEWCTNSENSLHAFHNNNQPGAFTEDNNPSSIRCLHMPTEKIFKSLKVAWKETKYPKVYETFLRNIKKETNDTNCKIL